MTAPTNPHEGSKPSIAAAIDGNAPRELKEFVVNSSALFSGPQRQVFAGATCEDVRITEVSVMRSDADASQARVLCEVQVRRGISTPFHSSQHAYSCNGFERRHGQHL